MYSILIVDDEPNYLVVLAELLQDEGYEVFTAPGGAKGFEMVKALELDLVITDMQMPEVDGLQLLQLVKEYNEELPVIMITAYAQVEKAVAAMQSGAFSSLAKPFSNYELLVNIKKAVQVYSLVRENTRRRRWHGRQEPTDEAGLRVDREGGSNPGLGAHRRREWDR